MTDRARLLVGTSVADVCDMPSEPATAAASMLRMLPRHRAAVLRSSAVRGNGAAFEALYQCHHQALYRYCRSILHHDPDARDALQSTMAKAFAALQSEERDFELRPWLFRIAHNEAISILRRRQATEELDPALTLGADTVVQAVENRERLAQLYADLADLPERQRAALVLRELSGLGHEEIANVLGCTARTVKQTIFEARTALHACQQGRAMACEDVQRTLSDGDGRSLRGRTMRAHLRSCASCRRFRAALERRPAELAALAPPLPVAAGAAVLAHLLPGGKAAAAMSGASAAASGGGGVAATLATKAAVTVAVLATSTGATVLATRHTAAPASRRSPAVQHRSVSSAAAAASVSSAAAVAARRQTAQRTAPPSRADRTLAERPAPGSTRSQEPEPRTRSPKPAVKPSQGAPGDGSGHRSASPGAPLSAHARTPPHGRQGSQAPQRPPFPAPVRRPPVAIETGRTNGEGSPSSRAPGGDHPATRSPPAAPDAPPNAEPPTQAASPSPSRTPDAGRPTGSPSTATTRAAPIPPETP